jgi:hypothetical protein
VNKSVDSEALAGVELNSLLENTHFEIMMRWLIIPAACLLVLLLAAVVGIAVNGVNQSSDLDVRYRYQTLIFYRAVLAADRKSTRHFYLSHYNRQPVAEVSINLADINDFYASYDFTDT